MMEENPFGRRAADKEHADRVTLTTRWVKGGIAVSFSTLAAIVVFAYRSGATYQQILDRVAQNERQLNNIELRVGSIEQSLRIRFHRSYGTKF